ncbi:Stk1 family PASTA domain-containing Ser/Thr kinase [Streptomyces sudanensis]|uniref:Stk1 family PASTA domain-containing Ser/Thr kinase n=1 Tax=Streptomyces sudanensis TaxID=436397 RepID=UPI0020CD15D2|nr:Stk1 family PASTA domain-containing Ser/Thr kinase [Streptomyces sudanensis]MCQ0000242.1 Stk1 family PASTA domain-containing Ser/Thr kinase [Streptomyces sudanensis]
MDTTLHDPLVGRLLDGRYRVDARIAVGGMATVYRAVDTRLDRDLALKVMHPSLAADASFVERFIREAKSVARLSHPNVVGVFDQGEDGPYVYLAMEYVAGCTLRDVLRERGALSPRAALDVLEPVLAALGAAHRAGFVHRDMKPENVLIGDDGRVKVADFGLVRAVGTATHTTGAVLGTVSYLAPEQIEHGTADTRTDVYACGVVLYEMLTGGKPHGGDTPAQALYRHLNDDVPAPSAAFPGLAPELDALVAGAAARDAGARPHDAVALLSRVRAVRAALGDAQLDLAPPGGRDAARTDGAPAGAGAGPDDVTSVVARPLPAAGDVERTSLLGMSPESATRPQPLPEPPAAAGGAPRRGVPALLSGPRRGAVAALAAVLLLLGAGAVVWYVGFGQFTRVPATGVLGKTRADAERRLADEGLAVGSTREEFSSAYERGTVMGTDPAPGERIRGNGSVDLVLSRGPEIVRVPDLRGQPLAAAKERLRRAGLAAGVVTREFDAEVARGSVVGTDPPAGTERSPDAAVALVVSRGAPIVVPNAAGRSPEAARTALTGAGLRVEVAGERVHSSHPAGSVAAQSLPAGARAAEGDTVTLTLSKGPRPVAVPDVTGQDVGDAVRRLEDAGFEVKVERSFPYLGDTVGAQSVPGGGTAPEGSTITLRVEGL